MGLIIVTGLTSATTADVLNNTRLQTFSAAGSLLIEVQASALSSTNQAALSVQLPDGETPANSILIPAGAQTAQAVLDDRELLAISADAMESGGHTVISINISGTVTVFWRVSFVS